MAKHTERFDPSEVEWLLMVAQGKDLPEDLPAKFSWVKKVSKIEARDNLLYRFQRLGATLVNVCLTGRPNPRSSYQKAFLQMFSSEGTSIDNVAAMLCNRLRYTATKKELFTVAQISILKAIEITRENLAATIVACFHDEILDLVKDIHTSPSTVSLSENSEEYTIEDQILFCLFIESLSPEEKEWAKKAIEGDKPKTEPPQGLITKLQEYKYRR